VYGEGASTRIGSFLSPPPFSSGAFRGTEKKKEREKKLMWGRELQEESETRCGESRTCVRLRETGNGYGPGWTDGRMGDSHGGVKAGGNEEREERVQGGATRVWTAATEPPRINPPLDERRCFCDLRSATIFAHSFCAIGVTGCLLRHDAKKE